MVFYFIKNKGKLEFLKIYINVYFLCDYSKKGIYVCICIIFDLLISGEEYFFLFKGKYNNEN